MNQRSRAEANALLPNNNIRRGSRNFRWDPMIPLQVLVPPTQHHNLSFDFILWECGKRISVGIYFDVNKPTNTKVNHDILIRHDDKWSLTAFLSVCLSVTASDCMSIALPFLSSFQMPACLPENPLSLKQKRTYRCLLVMRRYTVQLFCFIEIYR